MSWGPLLVNLAVTAGLVAVLMLATFGYAMRTRVHAIMDTIWPLGFVLIAVVTFGLSAGSGVTGRRVLVLVLTAVWGLRLSAHIYSRNRGQGEDKRYASLLRRNRGSLPAFVLRHIYWMQGRVMWFVSLPVQAAMYEHAPLLSSGPSMCGVAPVPAGSSGQQMSPEPPYPRWSSPDVDLLGLRLIRRPEVSIAGRRGRPAPRSAASSRPAPGPARRPGR